MRGFAIVLFELPLLLYQLPSALADGKNCNHRQALAELLKLDLFRFALAEALRMIDISEKFGSSR